MPELLTETTPSRRRRPLLYVGAIMWLLVAVSTFFLLQNRANVPDGQLPNDALLETELETGRGPDDKAAHTNGVSPPIPAEAIWDPQGIDDFELIDVDGEKVTKSHLLGKPWVVSFIFTRCLATCPAITASMRKLAADSKEIDVRFVSLSVDPNYDTPAVLKKYAAQHGAQKSRWLFLTGDQKEIHQLIYKSFKLPVKEITGEEREPGFQVIHSNFVLHVDSTGRVIGKYNGTKEAEMVRLRRKLAADQKAALEKKSNAEAEQIRSTKSENRNKLKLPNNKNVTRHSVQHSEAEPQPKFNEKRATKSTKSHEKPTTVGNIFFVTFRAFCGQDTFVRENLRDAQRNRTFAT